MPDTTTIHNTTATTSVSPFYSLYDYIESIWIRRIIISFDVCLLIIYPIYIMTLTFGSSTSSLTGNNNNDNTYNATQCKSINIGMMVVFGIILIFILSAYITCHELIQSLGSILCIFAAFSLIALFYNNNTCYDNGSNGVQIYVFIIPAVRAIIQAIICGYISIYIGLSLGDNINNSNNILNNNNNNNSNHSEDDYNDTDGQLILLSQLQYANASACAICCALLDIC